jgi:hypothetical protein
VLEISRAQKAGRRIAFSLTRESNFEDAVSLWGSLVGYDRWPSRSIVLPASDVRAG